MTTDLETADTLRAPPSSTLSPSDGQETIRCESCDATIVQGNSIVLLDLCESCDAELVVGAPEDCDPS